MTFKLTYYNMLSRIQFFEMNAILFIMSIDY